MSVFMLRAVVPRCWTSVRGEVIVVRHQACPICRVDLPPSPDQLFEEATRQYSDVQRWMNRREASWGALTKT